MQKMRNTLGWLIGGVWMLLAASSALAQAWPAKPVHLLVNLPPGTPPDQIARALSPRLAEALGQPFVVENRVGANGLIALGAVVKSAADGYTLAYTPMFPLVIGPHLFKMPFDADHDLVPVATTARVASFFVVRSALPVKNVAEFIAYARANPGKLNYGSGGNGSQPHVAAEMFAHAAALQFTHIPYKGSTETLTALLAGQIDFTFDVGVAIPQIKAGKLKLLAVASPQRSAVFPDRPTLQELGIDVNSSTVHAVYAPAGTPREVVQRLNSEIARAMQTPQLRNVLAALGADALTSTPEQVAAMQRRDREVFGTVVREAHIHAD